MEEFEISASGAEDALRHSWEVHRQAFGPILEPAFQENPQVRIHLIAALNHLSRREVKQGMKLLDQIKEHCIYDEDKAAWVFFVGLGFEMAGAKEQSLKWYADAGQYGHRFYLPYLKLAKAAYNAERYEEARDYYRLGIDCLLEMPENEKDEMLLGSAWTNLVSCLTMMRCFAEAEQAWLAASEYPLRPGAESVAAILYAAMGDREQAYRYLEQGSRKLPLLMGPTRKVVEQILRGEHPHFQEESGEKGKTGN